MQELMPVFKIYRPLPPGPGLPLGFTSYQLLKVLQCDAPNFPILDFSLEEHEQGGCGRASVTASRDLSLNHRDRIDIEILGELRYSGEIKTLPATGNAMTWEYGLVGFIDQLNDVQIQKYEIKWQVARSTVQSLITTHIAPKTDITPDTTQVQDTRSIPGWDSVIENLEFNWATPAEIIEVIRQMCGADWVYGIDARRRLYFRQRTNAAPTRIYSLGEKPLIGYVPERSSKRVKSKLHVEIGKFSNGDPFFMDFENAETRKTYGNREDRASLPAHFPLYGAENLIHTKDAALNSQGMPHIIDLDAIKDEDGMTYMDSGEAMTAGAQLWSKLGSTAEIVTPEVSQLDQDGHPTTGQIIGSPTFGAGKFGNAFQPSNGNYARYPTRANQITIAAGAAEFWWKPATDNPAGIAVFFDFSSPELTKGGILFHYEDRRLVISARVGGQYTASSRSAIQNWVAGTWYHIAVAWDTSANRLGYHAGVNSKTTAMMWINGVAVYRGTKQFSGGETNDYVNIGANLNGAGNTVASYGAIDNIKFYDHPNGRWQGWETEDVRKEAQGIIIQLDKEYPIGMIQVCSEPSDPQVEIGAHYAPGLRVYVGTGPSWPPPNWRLVYDSPSTGPLQEITYTPGIGTRWILIRISRSSTENWRVYGVGAYELKAQDVMQWANAYLAERAEEEISAAAEIERQIAPPTPGEKARVIDLDGHAQDYNIARVAWRAGGQTANLDLGENPRAVAPTLQAIYRQIIMLEKTEGANSRGFSSGSQVASGAIADGQVGPISADRIFAGSIRSRNYGATSGMEISLDAAKITVNDPGGLLIQAAGGITLAGGGIDVGVAGTIRGGQTDYNTGTGFFLGHSGGAYKFSIGNPAGNYLTFDGTTLTITGEISATTGRIGGWYVGTDSLYSTAVGTKIALEQANKRIAVYDTGGNIRVAIGYLDGLYRTDAYAYATAGGAATLTDTKQSWKTDDHKDKRVYIVAGVGIGQDRLIAGNTLDTLTVSPTWVTPPNATSIYEIRYSYTTADYGIWAQVSDVFNWDGDLVVRGGAIYATGTMEGGPVPSGPGTRLMWVPGKAAFRAGRISAGAAPGNYWDEANLGQDSFAFGSDCQASGIASFAGGMVTLATGIAAVALGMNTEATGEYGATALGAATKATGQSAFALGSTVIVSGNNSFAIGLDGFSRTLSAPNTFAVVGGNAVFGSVTPDTDAALKAYSTVNHQASFRRGAGTYDRLTVSTLDCGGNPRVGLCFRDPTGSNIGWLWTGSDGNLYFKSGAAPTSTGDGTKLN